MKICKIDLINSVNSNVASLLRDEVYNVNQFDSIDLLTSNRIDVIIKYLYVNSLLNGQGTSFYKQLYLDHIKAFNGFVEADDTNKVGSDAFDNNIKDLLVSIKNKGFDGKHFLPISSDNVPIDGAHRLAIALALGIKVLAFKINNAKSYCFDLKFFENRGLPTYELDHVAEQYAKIKANTYLVMVWPVASGFQNEIESILSKKGVVVYYKEIKLSINGMVNLQRKVYKNEQWLGTYADDFEGVWLKASQCYKEDGVLRVFLYETCNDLISIKNEIRSLFNIGKHAVHINDTHEETITLSNLLFNNNSIMYLNSSKRKFLKNYNRLLEEYKSNISIFDSDCFSLIGGVMSELGVREANDLDYITTLEDFPNAITNEIEKETKKTKYTNVSISDMIFNHQYYFKIDGIKFVCPIILLEIKQRRNNDRDKEDIAYLKNVISNNSSKLSFVDNVKKFCSISYYRRRIKLFLLNIRYCIYCILYGKTK